MTCCLEIDAGTHINAVIHENAVNRKVSFPLSSRLGSVIVAEKYIRLLSVL